MFQKLTNKKILFALLLLFLMTAPFVHAVVLESGIPGQLPPGTTTPNSIAQYINYLYLFVLGVVGIAVFASLVFWGVVWISSGIADKRGMALGKIKDAFTGLAIALGAYIILNTINPDLLTLKDLSENRVKITTKTKTSSMLEAKRVWYCFGAAPVGAQKVEDSECINAEPFNRYCGLNSVKACFRIITVPTIEFTSSPMASTCQPGTAGSNATYQWEPNCQSGWTEVSSTWCAQSRPGGIIECCGRCN